MVSASPGGRGGTIPPGSLLGHTYQIEQLLARGGMGEIYRARHAELGTEHAIKIILPELANDPKVVDLFRREAAVLRNVRDDAVVAYDGVFRDESGRLYLVMEYVEGLSLSDTIKERPLRPEEVRRLRTRLAHGLAAAHEKGVVHRDISPDNVILPGGRLENAKIIDFGIAKLIDPGSVTIVGEDFAGKYSFVSPEQLGMFGGVVDARSDIYSLGLVLAAATIGQPLDMGMSPISVVEARRSVPDLSQVPEELRRELSHMLQPNPEDRPQSMRELIAIEPPPERTGRPGRTGLGGASNDDLRLPRSGSRSDSGGSRKGLVIGGAVLGIAGALAGAYFYLGGPDSIPGAAPVDEQAPGFGAESEAAPGGPEASIPDVDEVMEALAPDTPEPASPATDPAPVATLAPDVPPQTAAAPPAVPAPEPAPAMPQPSPTGIPQPDPVALKTSVDRTVTGFDCATLSAELLPNGRVHVSGYVGSNADRLRLDTELSGLGRENEIINNAAAIDWPACREAVQILRTYTSAGANLSAAPQITPNRPEGVYREGEAMVLNVTATPLFDQYLYVDYVDAEGTVVHLFPSPRRRDNRVSAGERITLGAERREEGEVYRVGEPFGPGMILAIAAPEPLFDSVRDQVETADAYLAALRRSLERLSARGAGERPLARHLFTTALPH